MTGPNKVAGVQNVIEKEIIMCIDFAGNDPMLHFHCSTTYLMHFKP